MLRWRRLLSRNTVIAHRSGVQSTEWSSSPWKAKAHVAGFKMKFSSGRIAKIRYMVDADALLLAARGRPAASSSRPVGRTVDSDVSARREFRRLTCDARRGRTVDAMFASTPLPARVRRRLLPIVLALRCSP